MPERGAEYGAEVWRRIEGRLPVAAGAGGLCRRLWRWAGAAAALASLLVVAFLAGRYVPEGPACASGAAGGNRRRSSKAGERVLLVAVGDFLERSQMVLIELNQRQALGQAGHFGRAGARADLASENRLYRQTALQSGNTAMAGVLDDLERVLVDIAHEPSHLAPAELENLQHRLEAAGILFKIRVLGTNVKQKQEPAKPVGRPGRQKL